MTTVAVQPSRLSADATPRACLAVVSRGIRLYAPRTLKDPVRWRFSHLRKTGPATVSDSTRECITGVSEITSRSSLRAAATSSELTAPGVVATGGKCATPAALWHPDSRTRPGTRG